MVWNAAINIGLRGLTLCAKLRLIVVLARFLEPEDVGVYGLLVSVVGLSTFVLGFEFYRYNMRLLVPRRSTDRLALVRDQGVFHALLAVVVLPVLLGVFALDILPPRFAVWFYVLLVLDAISREGSNLLITLSRSATANLVLFLRSGSWVFLLAAYWLVFDRPASLVSVCLAWSLGSLTSVIVFAVSVARLLPRSAPLPGVDWPWVRKGMSVSLRFLVLILAMQGLVHGPRFFLQHFRSEAAVGIYTFYSGLTGPVQSFVEAGVLAILSPRAIAAFNGQGSETYGAVMRKMLLQTSVLLLVLIGVSFVGVHIVLDVVGNPAYREQLGGYWILLAASAVMALSWLQQLDLYVRGRDRPIMLCAVLSLGVAVVFYYLLIPSGGVAGAATATLIATATLLLSQIAVRAFLGRSGGSGSGGPTVRPGLS